MIGKDARMIRKYERSIIDGKRVTYGMKPNAWAFR